MIRVLVVDDSPTVRNSLTEILRSDPDFDVVGVAGDGRRAIELTAQLRPDVVTLDMVLPELSGLAATEHIMAHYPTPILIVSASFNRGTLFETYQALAAGAVDVLDKPSDGDDEWSARFLTAVRMVAKIKVITHPRGRLRALGRRVTTDPVIGPRSGPSSDRKPELIALGASTGGPSALVEVIAALPPSFQLPIVIVLHIGATFAEGFAEWLGRQTSRTIACARDGDTLDGPGRVLFAPPGYHVIIRGRRVRLTSDPPRHHCQPSIDVLFESLALEYGSRASACLLTGMGRDGATGLLAMRRAGAFTIAQDEATSIVYGMPREAALCGAAELVLPLHEIGPAIAMLAQPEKL
ncbi:MAG: response regulator receiver modulated CheB methylesterase [Myxococcales bacterium]|nr:response regulator receiver modulated CheB methylesterase [Myxococcales bacterium]